MTRSETKAALLKAWDEKRFGCQHPELMVSLGNNNCLYDYGNGIGCAIGVLWKPEDPRDNDKPLNALVFPFRSFGFNTVSEAYMLQSEHDNATSLAAERTPETFHQYLVALPE